MRDVFLGGGDGMSLPAQRSRHRFPYKPEESTSCHAGVTVHRRKGAALHAGSHETQVTEVHDSSEV